MYKYKESITSEEDFKKKCIRDYTQKTQYMVDLNTKQSDINEMINLLNYSFMVQNNFFCEEFNVKLIKNVYNVYNRMKTNILNKDCLNLFDGIDKKDLKVLKFICTNFVNNFTKISKNPDNDKILIYVSLEGLKRFGEFINIRIRQMQ